MPRRHQKRFRALALSLVSVLPLAQPAAARDHRGVFGLGWGKTPADARSILASKVTFDREGPAEEAPYDTIDQHYSGPFGKLPTTDIFLRFYRGEFFYMAVTLSTAEAKTAAKVWEQGVKAMTRVYGKPLRLSPVPQLASGKSIVDTLPIKENRAYVMPLLWNERTHQDEESLYALRDLQIRSALWDPFAGWKFDNGVIIQLFVYQERVKGQTAAVLRPLWIFVKDATFQKWKKAVRISKLIEPRDF